MVAGATMNSAVIPIMRRNFMQVHYKPPEKKAYCVYTSHDASADSPPEPYSSSVLVRMYR